MIIEKVTGMDFDQYLKKYIFDVCNMQSTGYHGLLITETAKKMAEHRQGVMEEYLEEFVAEWEGNR